MPQKYKTSSGSLEQATNGNPALKQILQNILNWMSNFTDVSGIDPRKPAGTVDNNSLTPPPAVQLLDVEGTGGHFIIKITPPDVQGVLYYLLQSSETLPFESSTTITNYGPTPNTTFDIVRPSTTLNWRVKAKFTNSDYGSVVITPDVSSGEFVLPSPLVIDDLVVNDDAEIDGKLTIGDGTGDAEIWMNKANLFGNRVKGYQNGVLRWSMVLANGVSETGSNAGSNFRLFRFLDDGVTSDIPLEINRATGNINLGGVSASPVIFSGAMDSSIAGSIVGGSVSGSAQFVMPLQGSSYKRVIIVCDVLNGTASYTFPTAFVFTPQILSQSLTARVTSLSTTAVTVTGLPSSGIIELSGF